MSEFTFNGVSCQEKGITLLDYKQPASSSVRVTYVDIPGRDGSLAVSQPVYQDVTVSLHCAILGDDRQEIQETLRQAAGWMCGQGELSLWDQPGLSRPGTVVEWSEAQVNRQWAEFTILFQGSPFLLGEEQSLPLGSAVQVKGTVPARGVVTVTLPDDTSRIRITSSHGESLALIGSLKAEQVISVDMQTGNIQLDGQPANRLMELGGQTFAMPPGTGTITCEALQDSDQYQAVEGTFQYRPQWS
ncbi:phage tail family protein [[Clostridium] leptum]|nr:phage tail family protein [[Clostridium] leptum]